MTVPLPREAALAHFDLEQLFTLLVSRVNQLLNCERCTVFLHDPGTKELWSRVTSATDRQEIRIPDSAGLAGECHHSGLPINVPDAYADVRFNRQVDLRTGFRTRNLLCFPIIGPLGEKVGVIQALNKATGSFSPADEHLLEIFAGQAAITLQNAMAERALAAARETERVLAAELAANHERLQQAFGDLSTQKAKLEKLMAQQKLVRRIAGVAGALIGLASLAVLVLRTQSTPPPVELVATGEAVAELRPISTSVMVAGILEPPATSNVICPFGAKVTAVHRQAGDLIRKGDLLVSLDTAQLDSELRDLESRLVEARRTEREIAEWASGRDVANARRNVDRTRAELELARTNASGTQKLFERGVVSESERRTAISAVANLESQLAAAEEDFAATLKRGDADSLKVARNALANIDTELTRKRATRALARLVAPHDGVILRPGQLGDPVLVAGRNVSEGDLLMRIGQLDGFSVRSSVDETEVLQIRVGQPVVVTGPAFPDYQLQGKVSMVNSQSNGASGGARFDIEATVSDLPSGAREKLLLGMSADASIQVYTNDKALVVPIGALRGTLGAYAVTVLKADATRETRSIRTGATGGSVIEVIEGLQAGEKVALYR